MHIFIVDLENGKIAIFVDVFFVKDTERFLAQ